MKNTKPSVLDRLSPVAISVFRNLSQSISSKNDIKAGFAVQIISQANKDLAAFFKSINVDEKLAKKVKVSDWLVTAFNEAYISNSELIELHHLILGLIHCISTDKYYLAKKQLPSFFENKTKLEFSKFVQDITELAKTQDHYFIGREKEITNLIVNLCYPNAKPILLVADQGAGKSSLMFELAKRIVAKKVPASLINTRILRIKFTSLMGIIPIESGQFSGQMLSQVLSFIANSGKENYSKTILFFDDLSLGVSFFVGAESSNAQTDVLFVGSANNEMQDKIWESPISKMWDVILLDDLSDVQYKEILNYHAKQKVKSVKNIKYSEGSIDKIIQLYRDEYLKESMPGAGIKLLEALNVYKRHIVSDYELINTLAKGVQKVKGNTQQAATVQQNLTQIVSEPISVSANDVETFLIGSNNIGGKSNTDDLDVKRILNLELELKRNIIGQDKAIKALAQALRISSLKLQNISRPVGAFLFLGPTGVGKTETARDLARALYGVREGSRGQPKNFIRIDMSEYSEKHAVSKLFGAPPGYVGYDDSASLCDFVSDNPNSVVLFDEIDKAHPDVLNSLLHIMEEGELRNSAGEIVSFENVIVLMTSNHGAELISKQAIGFEPDIEGKVPEWHAKLLENLKKQLKPEFINRLDHIVVFGRLTIKDLSKIASIALKSLTESLKKRDIKFTISEKAVSRLVTLAYKPEFGARELRRIINQELIDPMSKVLLSTQNVKAIKVDVKKSAIVISANAKN